MRRFEMLQRHGVQIALGVSIVISAICAAAGEDLLELTCSDELPCKQFEYSSIRAACVNGHCHCTYSEGLPTPCRPAGRKQSNIIGGPCPCTLPHAECNMAQDICYCAPDYMASKDRRRCILPMLPLGESCEQDDQCQAVDSAMICQQELHKCSCREGFMQVEDNCVSLLGHVSTSCEDDSECSKYGAEAICATESQKCVCVLDYVAAVNGSICMADVDFNEACKVNSQCQRNAGIGSACLGGRCQCQEGYWPLMKNPTVDNGSTKTTCVPILVLGEYCYSDEKCYQHHLPSNKQSMVCDHGECNCRWGYVSRNNIDCTSENHSAMPGLNKSLTLLFLALLVRFN